MFPRKTATAAAALSLAALSLALALSAPAKPNPAAPQASTVKAEGEVLGLTFTRLPDLSGTVKAPLASSSFTTAKVRPAGKAAAAKVTASGGKTTPSAQKAAKPASKPAAQEKPAAKAAEPARPYYPISAAERDKIERVVMTSCGGLGDSLMAKANAQVILDRIKSGRFGSSVGEVLDAPGQFERPWKGQVTSLVKEAVHSVFDLGNRVTSTRLYYYENPNLSEVDPSVWKKDKRYVTTIGTGFFIHEYWTDR